MIKNFLNKSSAQIPALAFHSMDLIKDNTIVIYGGTKSNNELSGDLYLLNKDEEKFTSAFYEVNNSSKNILIKSFLSHEAVTQHYIIARITFYTFSVVLLKSLPNYLMNFGHWNSPMIQILLN
jgi:hypothetical protein